MKTLEQYVDEIESHVISKRGFAGIGIVNYGDGEKIEISVIDSAAAEDIRTMLRESYSTIPISVVVTGKTTTL